VSIQSTSSSTPALVMDWRVRVLSRSRTAGARAAGPCLFEAARRRSAGYERLGAEFVRREGNSATADAAPNVTVMLVEAASIVARSASSNITIASVLRFAFKSTPADYPQDPWKFQPVASEAGRDLELLQRPSEGAWCFPEGS
jgi:hypothetical protein